MYPVERYGKLQAPRYVTYSNKEQYLQMFIQWRVLLSGKQWITLLCRWPDIVIQYIDTSYWSDVASFCIWPPNWFIRRKTNIQLIQERKKELTCISTPEEWVPWHTNKGSWKQSDVFLPCQCQLYMLSHEDISHLIGQSQEITTYLK